MNELQLVGYTADLTHLVFKGARESDRFRVRLDDDLVSTVEEVLGLSNRSTTLSPPAPPPPAAKASSGSRARGPAPGTGTLAAVGVLARAALPGADEAAPTRESKLSPREIQALLRAGKTPAQVAQLAGTHEELVQRWLPPIEAEREQVLIGVRRARLSKARLGPSRDLVGDAVRRNLAAKGVSLDDEDTRWLVSRRDGDDLWKVELRYRTRGRVQRARYRYDPETGTLDPRNDLATEIAWVRGRGGAAANPPAGRGSGRAAPVADAAAPIPSETATETSEAGAAAAGDAPAGAAAKGPAKRVAAKKAPAKRAAAKKPVAKKRVAKKSPAKKSPAKKSPAKPAAKRVVTRSSADGSVNGSVGRPARPTVRKVAVRKAVAERTDGDDSQGSSSSPGRRG